MSACSARDASWAVRVPFCSACRSPGASSSAAAAWLVPGVLKQPQAASAPGVLEQPQAASAPGILEQPQAASASPYSSLLSWSIQHGARAWCRSRQSMRKVTGLKALVESMRCHCSA